MPKKKETFTIEDKLQNALVPDWEQPYKLPENWCWTRLGNVLISSKSKTETFTSEQKYIGLENIEKDTGIVSFGSALELKSTKNIFKAGQILYGKLRPYLNKHDIASFDGVTSTDIAVFSCEYGISPFLINKYLDTDNFINYAVSNSKGINLPRVNESLMLNYPFPLPPLAEQKRIVDRIESLFAKLDEAKELAQNALDSFESRKSEILHKAFTGELTKKWREENGVSFDSREVQTLKNIIETIKTKYDPTTDSNEYKYVGLENIEKNNGITGYSTSENVKSIKTFFKKGDILYGKLRPYLNKHDIAYFDGICSTDILVFRAKIDVSAKFVNYIMNLQKFIEYTVSNSKGINLPRVSEKDIIAYSINLPTLPEQQEIVRILDSIFAKETEAKELVSVIDKIDLIKKSILSKAFHGELGTNDMNEESSVGLLREIISQQENKPAKPKKRNEKKVLVDGNVISQLATDFEEIIYKYIAENQPISMSSILDSVSNSKQLDALDTVSTLCKRGFIINKGETYSIK